MKYERKKIRKLIDSINYLVERNGGRINYTKLIKLLYLADRKALINWGFTITGDSYVSMKDGPVLSQTYDFIKGNGFNEMQNMWDEYFYTEGYDLIGERTNRNKDLLSPAEMEILETIDTTYKNYTYSQMIEEVHSPNVCPEWKDPGLSSFTIGIEDILRSSGKAEAEVKAVAEEYELNEEDERILIEHCR